MSSNGKWHQRAKDMKSKDGHPISSGKPRCTTSHSAQLRARIEEVLSRNARTVPVRLKGKLVDVCLATLVHKRGESWCRRFRTDSEQFQVQQWQASDRDAVMTSDAENDVSTPSTLMFHLTVFLFGLQSAVHPSLFVLVVLHWYRRHVTVESSARRFAAVDLGRSGSDDTIWTKWTRPPRAGT